MRMGTDCKKHYVMCEHHKFYREMHYVSVQYKHKGKDGEGKNVWSQGFELSITVDIGPKSTINESIMSLGPDFDREIVRVLK